MNENSPICASPIAKEEGEADWRCTGGITCPAQCKQAFLHFASRRAVERRADPQRELIEAVFRVAAPAEPAGPFRLVAGIAAAQPQRGERGIIESRGARQVVGTEADVREHQGAAGRARMISAASSP